MTLLVAICVAGVCAYLAMRRRRTLTQPQTAAEPQAEQTVEAQQSSIHRIFLKARAALRLICLRSALAVVRMLAFCADKVSSLLTAFRPPIESQRVRSPFVHSAEKRKPVHLQAGRLPLVRAPSSPSLSKP